MATDRSALVDLKFKSKTPTELTVEYLWQLGSYSFLQNIDRTIVLYILTDATKYYFVDINWGLPKYAFFRTQMRSAIERMGHKNYRSHAHYTSGPHCQYCDHRHKCPLQDEDTMVIRTEVANTQISDLGWLDQLQAEASSGKTETAF
jgi:hypothetical protein